jgi:hypothetical protein
MKKVLVTIPETLLKRVDHAACRAGLNRSELIALALERLLGGRNGRRLLDDPRVRKAWERIQEGDYGLEGAASVVAEIRRMRDTRKSD